MSTFKPRRIKRPEILKDCEYRGELLKDGVYRCNAVYSNDSVLSLCESFDKINNVCRPYSSEPMSMEELKHRMDRLL